MLDHNSFSLISLQTLFDPNSSIKNHESQCGGISEGPGLETGETASPNPTLSMKTLITLGLSILGR